MSRKSFSLFWVTPFINDAFNFIKDLNAYLNCWEIMLVSVDKYNWKSPFLCMCGNMATSCRNLN